MVSLNPEPDAYKVKVLPLNHTRTRTHTFSNNEFICQCKSIPWQGGQREVVVSSR